MATPKGAFRSYLHYLETLRTVAVSHYDATVLATLPDVLSEGSRLDAKLKHLEFIQAAIARMATNSFLFKGWAITIATGLSAFAAVDDKEAVLAIAVVSTGLFWGLDAYYLWLERGFIRLHEQVSKKNEVEIDFSMRIDKSNALREWFMTCWRPHLWMFYGLIIAVDVIGIFLIRSK